MYIFTLLYNVTKKILSSKNILHPKVVTLHQKTNNQCMNIAQLPNSDIMSVPLNFVVNTVVIQYCVYYEI